VTPGHLAKKSVLSFLVIMEGGGHNVFLDKINPVFLPSSNEPQIPLNEIPNIGSSINIKELFLNDPKDEFFNYFNYYTY